MSRLDLAWLGSDTTRRLATIHATVDLERAIRDAGWDAAIVADAVTDAHLGARLVLDLSSASGTAGDRQAGAIDVRIAIAEPATEGRLAAFLARHGEGVAGFYVDAGRQLAVVRAAALRAGIGISREEAGPFGPSVRVLGGGADSQTIILVAPRTVPSPP